MFDFNEDDMATIDRAFRDPAFFCENFLYNESGELYKLEQYQKLFLRDKHPYRILFLGRRMGKTLVSVMDILHKCIFNENYRVSITSPTKSQAETISETMTDLLTRSSVVGSLFTKDNVFKKRLVNGSRIHLATAGKDSISSLIGSGVNMLFIDESQDIDDSLYSKIIPITRAQQGQSRVVFAGTPRGKEGFFYRNIMNPVRVFDNCELKSGVKGGMYSLHRKPSGFLDEDDNVIDSGTPRITIEELKEDQSTMGNLVFRQEYCLQFLDSIGEVFSPSLIEEATLDTIPPKFESKARCVAGVDFGKKRNNTVLMIGELNTDGSVDIKWIKKWELGVKYKTIIDYLKTTLPSRFPNLRKLAPDATGIGIKIIEDLEDVTAYEIEPIVFTRKNKVELVESAVARLEDRKVRFIKDKRLEKEMKEYKRDMSKENITYKKGESDDYVDSLILTIEASRTVAPPREPFVFSLGQNIMNKVQRGNDRVESSSARLSREIGLIK